MKKLPLGIIAGTSLGLLDGLSAFFVPEAAGMIAGIVIGSTVKGLVNGIIAGVIAKRASSVFGCTILSGVAGLVLSVLAAIPSGAYTEIVVPGTVVGFLTGFITAKWGR